jgi:hypothetical protein
VTRGNEAYERYEQGDYRRAAALYRDSYATFPHELLLFNAARAHHLGGNVILAQFTYEEYLALPTTEPSRRRRAERYLAGLKQEAGAATDPGVSLIDRRTETVAAPAPLERFATATQVANATRAKRRKRWGWGAFGVGMAAAVSVSAVLIASAARGDDKSATSAFAIAVP